jgi:hypothetical protein
MTHLTADELIDAMEGMLAPERQAHLTSCDECQRELAELSNVLSEAKQVSVPDPLPLFWNHFSERVRGAIDADVAAGPAWPEWLRWQVLAPVGALAVLILTLLIALPRRDNTEMLLETSVEELPPSDNWVMLTDLVGDIDLDTASAAGVIEPGVADEAVLQLTAEEQQELTRLLRAELQRAKL